MNMTTLSVPSMKEADEEEHEKEQKEKEEKEKEQKEESEEETALKSNLGIRGKIFVSSFGDILHIVM